MKLVKISRPLVGLLFGTSLLFGFTGTSHAVSCSTFGDLTAVGDTSDVTVESVNATSCGTGTTTNDTVPTDSTWQVNLDNAGGMSDWAFYEKEEDDPLNPGNIHDGNTSAIGLTSSTIGDGIASGTFSIANAFDPFLIVMKSDQGLYQWYMFEGQSGALNGTWDANIFGGKDLSHLSIYTKVVPIPAAVWLFGSGLLGLVGIARRKKAA